jgi:monofunctional biosynthetic peptidoglycan transglycosylase
MIRIINISIRIFLIAFLVNILGVILFRFVPIPTTSFIIQQDISNLWSGNNSDIEYEWIPSHQISKSVKLAVIAAEDQKFIDHFGFDLESISEAIKENEKGKRIRGASTITQQTAKNLFLWPGKSMIRKGLEAYFTVLLELFWSKQRILEVYLNIAEFGENVYGIEAASKRYFNKNAFKLSNHEAAIIASVLPNPKKYRINQQTQYLAKRTQWIEKQMRQLGENYLDQL